MTHQEEKFSLHFSNDISNKSLSGLDFTNRGWSEFLQAVEEKLQDLSSITMITNK